MKVLLFIAYPVLMILSLRRVRWAYIAFVVLGLFYFPFSVGFQMSPRPCEVAFSGALAVHSLTNYAHIILFTLFFLMSSAQFRMSRWSGFCWAALAAITMGALVELAQGITGKGHCRARDLIPDSVGILIGCAIVLIGMRLGRGMRQPAASS